MEYLLPHSYKTKRELLEVAVRTAQLAVDSKNWPIIEKYKSAVIMIAPMFTTEEHGISWFYTIVWADDPQGRKRNCTAGKGDRDDLLRAAKAHVDQIVK